MRNHFLPGLLLVVGIGTASAAPCPMQRAAASGSTVWLLCEKQSLVVSRDAGRTWQVRPLPVAVRLRTVALLDERRGFIAGDEGTLLSSRDGAETWRTIPVPTKENLTSIHFVGERGWISGWNGVILHSPDGGITWEPQESGVRQGLDSIFFADPQRGWAVGWNAALLRTTDGGRSWQKLSLPAGVFSLDTVWFRSATDGWAAGFGGTLVRTRDGGNSWEVVESPVRSRLSSILFDPQGRGWIAADNAILRSDDGGSTWQSIPLAGAPFLNQVLWIENRLWGIGQFGVVRQEGEHSFASLTTLPAPRSALLTL